MPLRQMEPRNKPKTSSPLYNDNRLKLGIFGTNCSHGCTITEAETTFQPTYEHNRKIAETADRLGFEMLVPVGRWKGFGGTTDFNGTNMETHTWATAMACHTENIMIFSTSHIPAYHPILAAKQGATIDHVSDGRYGLNIVSGWFTPEMEMFGAPQLEHDRRYQKTHEWAECVKQLWTEQNFDYHGEFFDINDGYLLPKPVQDPYPVIVNAGRSEAGKNFSARHADFNFITINTIEDAEQTAGSVRKLAREEHGREIGVLTYALICCAETEDEAQARYDYILEEGDWEATKNIIDVLGLESGSYQETIEKYAETFIAGWGGYPIVGTPEQVVEELQKLSSVGIDGVILSWLDYYEELQFFGREVLPLMEEAGLRNPA